jgi:hypothetical protein
MVRTTRPTSCRTERSRSGDPSGPRKYLEATTLVASADQLLGTSTSFCSKITLPDSPAMDAVRISQAISSAGSTPGVVKVRGMESPLRATRRAPRFPLLCPWTSFRSIMLALSAMPLAGTRR